MPATSTRIAPIVTFARHAQHSAIATDKHADKLNITAERVLEAIAAIAFGDIRGMFDENGRLLRPAEWDDETAAAVAGMDVTTVNLGEGAYQALKGTFPRIVRLREACLIGPGESLPVSGAERIG